MFLASTFRTGLALSCALTTLVEREGKPGRHLCPCLLAGGGATKKEKCNPLDLAKSALTLLKCLPASRTAIFEYFCDVFDNAALNYIEGIETEIKTGKLPPLLESDELVISEIHTV
ncbi:hypothetical protein NQ318_015668 [Aromia moschata]|uniref:Integrator complex subunit 5 N-terminal domain-containing protein n=1 Tax=Aromia moschata TaxID=1265417 RepID=A0AAV8XR01_9CUCU|nr:hypothetical protein NQ318_015668 [Aromia moschata]